MAGTVIVPKVIEDTLHLWGRGMEVNGVVYEGVANINTSLTMTGVNAKSFNVYPHGYPGGIGTLKEVELGFTVEFRVPDNNVTVINWRVQGRNASGPSNEAPFDVSWVALCVNQEQTRPINAGWQSSTLSGYPTIQTNFNKVPFEVQLSYQANTTSVSQARIKNSSYVKYQYTLD